MRIRLSCLLLAVLWTNLPSLFAQGTAFTYQGRLNNNGSPVNGNYDFLFALYNDPMVGSQVGATQTNSNLGVTNGLFLSTMDFGGSPWTGQPLWLQILVRPAGNGSFTALSPRQAFNSTPYAIQSLQAVTASNAGTASSVPAAGITGTLSNSTLPASPTFSGTATGTFAGNGAGLTNLNASQLTNGTVADARLSTNVALLNSNQTFTGSKTFSNLTTISTAGAAFAVQGSTAGGFGAATALIQNTNTSASAGPALRVVGYGNSTAGVLSVSSEGPGLLAQFGNTNVFVSQLDTNGNWTANSFTGNGSGLTGLNATQLSNGTVADTRLSTNVALLNSNQTFTGLKTFANSVVVSPGSGTLTITNDSGTVPGIVASGGGLSGHARFRNGLEVWPDNAGANAGYLDVRNTSSNASIVLTGSNGAVGASTVNAVQVNTSTIGGNGAALNVATNAFLDNHALYLRTDMNHGLGYNGQGISNFPNAAVQPDGPVLWGYTGGVLGVLSGGAQSALSWNNSTVSVANALNVGGNATITGTLSAANTPGVGYSEANFVNELLTANANQPIDSWTSAKPAPGFFVIIASANIGTAGNSVEINLLDTNTDTILATTSANPTGFGEIVSLSLSWVEPIATAGGTESFEVYAIANGSGAAVFYHNLSVMYFPRQN